MIYLVVIAVVVAAALYSEYQKSLEWKRLAKQEAEALARGMSRVTIGDWWCETYHPERVATLFQASNPVITPVEVHESDAYDAYTDLVDME